MTREVKFASSSYGLELVIGQTASEMTPGGCQSVIKNIVRVIHLIDPENRLKATLIKSRVVCDQGKALDARGDLLPHIWEYWSSVGVFRPQAVNPLTEPLIVIGLGMNEHTTQNERFGIYGISEGKEQSDDIPEIWEPKVCIPKP